MGKYRSNSVKRETVREDGPHVIWRGIGCLMLLVIPVISWAAGVETIKYGLKHGWPIPFELLGAVTLPDLFYKSNGLMIILGPILPTQNFYAYLTATFLYMIMIGGVISLVYAVTYRIVGPSRYGPTDAPPPKIKTKKYTR